MLDVVKEVDSGDESRRAARDASSGRSERTRSRPKIWRRVRCTAGIWLLPPTISAAWIESSLYPRSRAPLSAARTVWLISVNRSCWSRISSKPVRVNSRPAQTRFGVDHRQIGLFGGRQLFFHALALYQQGLC